MLVQNISKLSNSMNKYLAKTEVETFSYDEEGVEELSPQQLQQQITRKYAFSSVLFVTTRVLIASLRFLDEADTDGDGKISANEFKAFALQHPETLVGLVRMRRILIELLQRCKKIRLRREREREEGGGLRGKLGKPF